MVAERGRDESDSYMSRISDDIHSEPSIENPFTVKLIVYQLKVLWDTFRYKYE